MTIFTQREKQFYIFSLFLVLALAFWYRWQFIQTINLYPDEFVTLLAMDMIGQQGVPVLPSGLFYEHGLLYSYLAGFVALLGEPALLGRVTSLALGLVTIGLTYFLGQRWFSPAVGLLAAIGLALTPAAIHWHGRVRMYSLLQLLVLLTLWFMLISLYHNRARAGWYAVISYIGALFTQFVSVALFPPLSIAEMLGFQTLAAHKGWYRNPQIWLRGVVIGIALLAVFLLKRFGQPKGIEPLEAGNAVSGIWQILTIYSSLSFEIGQSWQAISAFFSDTPNLIFAIFIPVAIIASYWQTPRYGPTLFLAVVLGLTTVEVIVLAPSDRRDDKYLFMLLPVLFLLGGQGIYVLGQLLFRYLGETLRPLMVWLSALVISVGLVFYSQNSISTLLADVGEDYTTAFTHVAENMQDGDSVLTGTPAAAYYYLRRNDYYAVQAGGIYDYRILQSSDGDLVERWLGSPWLQTPEALTAALTQQPTWLILERWGLLVQYYDPPYMQTILAQTEFVREDNGIIALKSVEQPMLLQKQPAVPAEALMNGTAGDAGQIIMRGYTLENQRLTLYWEPVIPVSLDYTVFVNIQNDSDETVWQGDHRPLGIIYPTTLWPAGQLIRETTNLDLPDGVYQLRVGMYLLETGERLWVPSDDTMQNMVYLGPIEIKMR
ncbi:MAG: glycosyltransferase family 39 protein [Chloroflexota bacterium]